MTAAAVFCLSGPAQAGTVDPEVDNEGINASAMATIRINGDVKGSGSSVTASSPALCWWEKSEIDTAGAAGIETILQLIKGLGSMWGGGGMDFSTVEKMLKDQKEKGEPLEWYVRKSREGATEKQLEEAGCNDPSGPYQGIFLGMKLRPFEPGNPPEPLPDPQFMAEVAVEHLDIEEPELNWNPKAASLGGGTLVNLPTWFWVNNPEPAIGDTNGERSVTATAGSGGNEVSVTVTAKSGQLQISSPGGAVSCSTKAARVRYSRTAAESSACILPFERASTGAGFPVVATVAWSASWTGTGPGVPGGEHGLNGITQRSETLIPVRESQATVRDVG